LFPGNEAAAPPTAAAAGLALAASGLALLVQSCTPPQFVVPLGGTP
jgi:hypothetical protein